MLSILWFICAIVGAGSIGVFLIGCIIMLAATLAEKRQNRIDPAPTDPAGANMYAAFHRALDNMIDATSHKAALKTLPSGIRVDFTREGMPCEKTGQPHRWERRNTSVVETFGGGGRVYTRYQCPDCRASSSDDALVYRAWGDLGISRFQVEPPLWTADSRGNLISSLHANERGRL